MRRHRLFVYTFAIEGNKPARLVRNYGRNGVQIPEQFAHSPVFADFVHVAHVVLCRMVCEVLADLVVFPSGVPH